MVEVAVIKPPMRIAWVWVR